MSEDVKFYIANEDGTYDPIIGRIETMEISYVNEYEDFVKVCILAGAKNNRIRHLALYSKKKRIRKKNRSRAFENIWL